MKRKQLAAIGITAVLGLTAIPVQAEYKNDLVNIISKKQTAAQQDEESGTTGASEGAGTEESQNINSGSAGKIRAAEAGAAMAAAEKEAKLETAEAAEQAETAIEEASASEAAAAESDASKAAASEASGTSAAASEASGTSAAGTEASGTSAAGTSASGTSAAGTGAAKTTETAGAESSAAGTDTAKTTAEADAAKADGTGKESGQKDTDQSDASKEADGKDASKDADGKDASKETDKKDASESQQAAPTVEVQVPSDISLETENGKFVYEGFETVSRSFYPDNDFTDPDGTVVFNFAFTNLSEKEAYASQYFKFRAYQNGVELTEVETWREGEQTDSMNHYFEKVPVNETVTVGKAFIMDDDSPVTLVASADYFGSFETGYMVVDTEIQRGVRSAKKELPEKMDDIIYLETEEGTLAYSGFEAVSYGFYPEELQDYTLNTVVLNFVYANKSDQPKQVQKDFSFTAYQNNEELKGPRHWFEKQAPNSIRNYYRTVLKDGVVIVGLPFVLVDDSPVTIVAKAASTGETTQMVIEPISLGMVPYDLKPVLEELEQENEQKKAEEAAKKANSSDSAEKSGQETANTSESGNAAGTANGTESGNAAGTATGSESGNAAGTANGTESGNAAGTANGTENGNAAGTANGSESGNAAGTANTSENADAQDGKTSSVTGQIYTDYDTVYNVQEALNLAGYNCGEPDGAIGRKTKSAIASYQSDHAMKDTDGQIDDELVKSLNVQPGDTMENKGNSEN